MSETDQTPITGQRSNGPVEISWSISGAGYTECPVVVKFNDEPAGKNTLHPGNVNWDTGKHVMSDGWLELNLEMTVPTADQEGVLEIVRLASEQGHEGPQVIEGIQLVTWTPAG